MCETNFDIYMSKTNSTPPPLKQTFQWVECWITIMDVWDKFGHIYVKPPPPSNKHFSVAYLTRQSEMANTSPRHMPVLGIVHPIKIENFNIFFVTSFHCDMVVKTALIDTGPRPFCLQCSTPWGDFARKSYQRHPDWHTRTTNRGKTEISSMACHRNYAWGIEKYSTLIGRGTYAGCI